MFTVFTIVNCIAGIATVREVGPRKHHTHTHTLMSSSSVFQVRAQIVSCMRQLRGSLHHQPARRGNLQNFIASSRVGQTICSPSPPSSFLPLNPSHPPRQQLQGSSDVGAPCSEKGERERGMERKPGGGRAREDRAATVRKKIENLPLAALVDNDTGRVILKQ